MTLVHNGYTRQDTSQGQGCKHITRLTFGYK